MPEEKTLVDYLMETMPEAVVVAPTAEVVLDPIAVDPPIEQINPMTPMFPDEEMTNLMAQVKRIGMCAKDLHYRAKGKPFYGLHQLADLAYQVEEDTDHIAEVYFLGDRGIEPPRMDEVFRRALDVPVLYPRDDKYFIGGLMSICRQTMLSIENIKANYEVKSGVAAVLDKISEHCLLSIGLLDQTLKGA